MLDFHPQCNRHRFGEDTQVTDDDSQVRYHIQQKHREDRKGRHVTQFQWYQYTEWSEDQHSVQPGHLMSLSPPPHLRPLILCTRTNIQHLGRLPCPGSTLLLELCLPMSISLSPKCIWGLCRETFRKEGDNR